MSFKKIFLASVLGTFLFSLNAGAVRHANVRDAAEDLLYNTDPTLANAKHYALFVDVPETDPRREEIARSERDARGTAEAFLHDLKERTETDRSNMRLKRAISIGELCAALSDTEIVPFSFILDFIRNRLDQ